MVTSTVPPPEPLPPTPEPPAAPPGPTPTTTPKKVVKLTVQTLQARARKIADCQEPTCPALFRFVGEVPAGANKKLVEDLDTKLKSCEVACSSEP